MDIAIRQAYICHDPIQNEWFVSTVQSDAELYEHYESSFEDLETYSSYNDDYFQGFIIKTSDGYFQYREHYDDDGDFNGGEYINVTKFIENKNRLAS